VTVSRPVGGILSGAEALVLCGLPEVIGRAARPLLDLAPGGVYLAAGVASGAGALLPHRFTLTCDRLAGPSAVCSLLHFPSPHDAWLYASTLPCGVPTFLDRVKPCRGHPANSPSVLS